AEATPFDTENEAPPVEDRMARMRIRNSAAIEKPEAEEIDEAVPFDAIPEVEAILHRKADGPGAAVDLEPEQGLVEIDADAQEGSDPEVEDVCASSVVEDVIAGLKKAESEGQSKPEQQYIPVVE